MILFRAYDGLQGSPPRAARQTHWRRELLRDCSAGRQPGEADSTHPDRHRVAAVTRNGAKAACRVATSKGRTGRMQPAKHRVGVPRTTEPLGIRDPADGRCDTVIASQHLGRNRRQEPVSFAQVRQDDFGEVGLPSTAAGGPKAPVEDYWPAPWPKLRSRPCFANRSLFGLHNDTVHGCLHLSIKMLLAHAGR